MWQSQTIRQPPHFLPGPRAIAANNEPLGGLPPADDSPATVSLAKLRCQGRLGRLLKRQYRVAATFPLC
jgi:hypothetical protein